jgi:hypothetical protein
MTSRPSLLLLLPVAALAACPNPGGGGDGGGADSGGGMCLASQPTTRLYQDFCPGVQDVCFVEVNRGF